MQPSENKRLIISRSTRMVIKGREKITVSSSSLVVGRERCEEARGEVVERV
jgi:hypothetical protein